MKRVLVILMFLFLLLAGFILYDTYLNRGIPKLDVEDEKIAIDQLYVYGGHMGLSGNLINNKDLDLVLYNGDFISYDINIVDDKFNLSDMINNGIYLDNLEVSDYYIFLRSTFLDDNGENTYKYYSLVNDTEYEETSYYTFKSIGNKVVIKMDDGEYDTLMVNVTKNKDKNIYDVVVDPGHGGIDSGTNKNGYYEAELTMKIAKSLKKKLEDNGFTVKLTREENQLSKDEKLNDYGKNGRAIIPYEVGAKYVFSIHLNSSEAYYVNGLEIYTANNINYKFAKNLANNLNKETGINYSTSRINKISDGVYTRMFTKKDIEDSTERLIKDEKKPYDITTDSNYYFMIRETGGFMTGAYVDNRNDDVIYNPYYNSNVGIESYLLELGYLSNKDDLNNILNNTDKFTDSIAKTFTSFIEDKNNM